MDAQVETLDHTKLEHGLPFNQLKAETSSRNDGRRREREFRGRQVQMMAISTTGHTIC
jgi:hypothetical protein